MISVNSTLRTMNTSIIFSVLVEWEKMVILHSPKKIILPNFLSWKYMENKVIRSIWISLACWTFRHLFYSAFHFLQTLQLKKPDGKLIWGCAQPLLFQTRLQWPKSLWKLISLLTVLIPTPSNIIQWLHPYYSIWWQKNQAVKSVP